MEGSKRDAEVRESGKKCTLCEGKARMFCESDEAMLCWDCDAQVHGANFLVAKHVRALLCRSCLTPTTWKSSGPRLTPTVSLCSHCSFGSDCRDGHGLIEEDMQSSEDKEVDNGKEDDDEGDNQVVPWGMPVDITTTTPVACSSSSEGSTYKRARHDPAEESSSPKKDDEAELTSTAMQQQLELNRTRRAVKGVKGALKTGRHGTGRREKKRSMPLTHMFVSAAGRRQTSTFSSTVVAGEQPMSCSSARQSISHPDYIQC